MGEEKISDEAKMWAMLSYASFFLGFPLGVVPLLQKKDAYAIHHAKHATAVYLAFVVVYFGLFLLTFVLFCMTFGLSHLIMLPLLMLTLCWPMTVAVHGVVIVINEAWTAPIGSFGLGDRLFSNIQVEDVASDASPADDDASNPS